MGRDPSLKHSEDRRNRRIQRQRQEIMDAAARLFAERGYAATTTKDIALTADVGESTLYGYFPGKREVLLAILSQQAHRIDSLLAGIRQLTDRQGFLDLIDALMETAFSHAVYTRALIAEAWVNDQVLNDYLVTRLRQIMGLLEAFIADKAEQGLLRPIDPRLGARVLVGSFLGVVLPQLRGVEPSPSPEQRRRLAEAVLGLLMGGLAAHPAPQGTP
jgi:AcrR family transcriptional regulator